MHVTSLTTDLDVPEGARVWLLRAPRESAPELLAAFGDGVAVRDGPQTDELANVALLWLRDGDDVTSSLLYGSESLLDGGHLWVLPGSEAVEARVRDRARLVELEVQDRRETPWGPALRMAPRKRKQPWADL